MMPKLLAITTLLALAVGVIAQVKAPPVELRESPFFEGEIVIETRDGPRTLKIELKQYQLDGHARIALDLPSSGMVVFQHRAGEVELSAGKTEFEPLEGEWMTIDLPEQLMLSTEDDAALIDVILVSE
ncbi:MAG: hypothetical protein WD795_19210 [Woeseia sp.]